MSKPIWTWTSWRRCRNCTQPGDVLFPELRKAGSGRRCALPPARGGGPLHPFRRQCPLLQHSGCEDMLIDTVGMGTLFLPDLQYHFRGMDPNWMVNHAYNRRHSGCAHSAETEWWHGQIHRNMDCATLWKEKARMGYMDSTKLCGQYKRPRGRNLSSLTGVAQREQRHS